MFSEHLIVIFAKYPTAGRVKTRLIGGVTPAQAAEIHDACLRHTVEVAADVNDAACWLAHSPDEADFTAYLSPRSEARPQGPGDLGERLSRIAMQAFEAGFRRIVLMGCDCPSLTAGDVKSAFDSLDEFDIAIGPAADGGYYLLAMRAYAADLFRAIDWGSSRVLQQTMDRAAGAGLRVHRLAERSDLDTPADLQALLSDSGANGAALRHRIEYIINQGETSG